MIAIESQGYFTTTPAFHGRVERQGVAGLRVHGLSPAASGAYTVEVNARGDVTLWRNATVDIVGEDNLIYVVHTF